MTRIVIIGAGGFDWTRRLVTDILTFPDLRDGTIALVDINAGKLKAAERICRKLIAAAGTKTRVVASTDRAAVLKGADAVLITILCGSTQVWRHDIEIPHKYGVDINVGDTRGPSGVFRMLRTAPAMLDIVRDAARLCPNAIVLNYTNPMAMLCNVLQRETSATVVGLCHSVQGTSDMLAKWCGVPPAEISHVCAGLNHLAWFLKLEHNGRDLYPRLREVVRGDRKVYNAEQVRNEVFLALGYYVTESSGHNSEYSAWFRKRPDLIEKYCTHGTGWNPGAHAYILQGTRQREKSWRKRERDWLALKEPPQIVRSQEFAVSIVNAWVTGEIYRFNGNVPNDGLITNLPRYCVEVPVICGRRQLQAAAVGDLPAQVMPLTATHAYAEMLAVEGCLRGDPELIFQSVVNDPLTAAVLAPAEIRKMVAEMLRRNKPYLPQFKSVAL